DAVVRADLEEVLLELLPPADVDGDHLVRQAALLQHDADLLAVGGRPVIEVDHRTVSPLPPICASASRNPGTAAATPAADSTPRRSAAAVGRYPSRTSDR